MTEAIISAAGAVVVGLLSLAGVAITNHRANERMRGEAETAQALANERITELTREVRMHNNFAQRVPILEEQMKAANRRLKNLEEERK